MSRKFKKKSKENTMQKIKNKINRRNILEEKKNHIGGGNLKKNKTALIISLVE